MPKHNRMNSSHWIAGLATGVLQVVFFASPIRSTSAALVFLRGSDVPVAGFVERQDADVVVIRQELPDGRSQTRELRRAEVEDIIFTVSKERLQALTPDSPAAYRDYAEELAEKRKDPEAREASRRLYLIAAYLDPKSLGRSSVLGMLSLARSPAEQRKYRAMAYLLDPQHDKRILQTADEPVDTDDVNDDEAKALLITALRAVRNGDTRAVDAMAKRPAFRQALQRWPGGLTYDQFMALRHPLPEETLARLLRLELSLTRQLRKKSPADSEKLAESWSQIVQESADAPVPSLSLETLTEYDPRECVFRDDRWVRPEDVASNGF